MYLMKGESLQDHQQWFERRSAEPSRYETGVSVVVPVYRSQTILPELVARLAKLGIELGSFELLLVNDGSPDHSWDSILQLVQQYPWVRGINLMRNYGQHNALLCGVRAARREIVVTMDDDLQHPPEEVSKLISALTDDFDVVYGTPTQQQHGVFRDLASMVTKWVLEGAMGAQTARKVSAFRAFRTELREAFTTYSGPFVNLDVLLTWGTRKFTAIAIQHQPRHSGESNYTLRQLFVHALNLMTGFSTLPLQIASVMGFVFTFFGLAALGVVLVRYFTHGSSVPGFPFLASIIAIFSGAQLFALGIMGEYLARMHFRMMERPPYAVRATASYPR
jgi:glycosyltransferase involved in cell wall biosynthesis